MEHSYPSKRKRNYQVSVHKTITGSGRFYDKDYHTYYHIADCELQIDAENDPLDDGLYFKLYGFRYSVISHRYYDHAP